MKEAVEILKPIPFGDGWEINFTDQNYVYISYNGGQLRLRYDMQENKFDKVLDCRGFNICEAPTMLINVGCVFSADGQYSVLYTATSGEEKDSLEFRKPFPFEYMYKLDFENETIVLLSKGFNESVFPDLSVQKDEEEREVRNRYYELTKSNIFLPQPTPNDFDSIAQINEDRYCIIKQIDGEIPDREDEEYYYGDYYYYELIIVDVAKNEIVQRCLFSSLDEEL